MVFNFNVYIICRANPRNCKAAHSFAFTVRNFFDPKVSGRATVPMSTHFLFHEHSFRFLQHFSWAFSRFNEHFFSLQITSRFPTFGSKKLSHSIYGKVIYYSISLTFWGFKNLWENESYENYIYDCKELESRISQKPQ